MHTKSVYEDGPYLANNPTWHEQDSPWKAVNIDELLKKIVFIYHPFARLDAGRGPY